MRCVAIAALVGCALLFPAAPSVAQKARFPKKGRLPVTQKTPAKEAPAESQYVPQITEIAGKDLEEWIKEIGARDPSTRENAIRTVLLFGPEQARKAVPALIAELKKHSFTYPLDLSVRTNATLALGAILSTVKDPDPKQVESAVTLMKRMLSDTQDIVKYRAAQALGQLGPVAKETVPGLLIVTRDGLNWETRQAAVAALGRVAVPTVPAKGKKIKMTREQQVELVKVIVGLSYRARSDHESSSQVRLSALHSLAFLGPWIRAVNSPDGERIMDKDLAYSAANDPSRTVRVWANFALMVVKDKVDPKRVAAIGELLAKSKLPTDRVQAAQALGMMGEKAKSQVPRLVDALDDKDSGVVAASLVSLAQIGGEGMERLASALARGQTATLRIGAAQALGLLGTKAKAQIPGLIAALDDKDKAVAAAAMLALAQMGDAGLEAVSKRLLESKDVAVRIQAAQALGAAGPKAKSQVNALVHALGDPDKGVVETSIWALGTIGRDAGAGLSRLQQVARNMDNPEGLRHLALAAIEVIEGRAEAKKELKKPPAGPR